MEAQNRAIEGHPVAVENHPRAPDAVTGAVRAQSGVVEAQSGVVSSLWSYGGSLWSHGGSLWIHKSSIWSKSGSSWSGRTLEAHAMLGNSSRNSRSHCSDSGAADNLIVGPGELSGPAVQALLEAEGAADDLVIIPGQLSSPVARELHDPPSGGSEDRSTPQAAAGVGWTFLEAGQPSHHPRAAILAVVGPMPKAAQVAVAVRGRLIKGGKSLQRVCIYKWAGGWVD